MSRKPYFDFLPRQPAFSGGRVPPFAEKFRVIDGIRAVRLPLNRPALFVFAVRDDADGADDGIRHCFHPFLQKIASSRNQERKQSSLLYQRMGFAYRFRPSNTFAC